MRDQTTNTEITALEIAAHVFQHLDTGPTPREEALVHGLISALLPRISGAFVLLPPIRMLAETPPPTPTKEEASAA